MAMAISDEHVARDLCLGLQHGRIVEQFEGCYSFLNAFPFQIFYRVPYGLTKVCMGILIIPGCHLLSSFRPAGACYVGLTFDLNVQVQTSIMGH